MASAALIIKDDGSVEATPELGVALHLKPGTRLELVEQSAGEIHFRVPSYLREIHSWRDLEGILADPDFDPNLELELEKQRELESEGR
jgi:uncharacterized protein YlzI (FlbEa/FlbD family)